MVNSTPPPNNSDTSISDSAAIFAVLDIVLALAERVTGERVSVRLSCSDGVDVRLSTTPGRVIFEPKEESSTLPALSPKDVHMRP